MLHAKNSVATNSGKSHKKATAKHSQATKDWKENTLLTTSRAFQVEQLQNSLRHHPESTNPEKFLLLS